MEGVRAERMRSSTHEAAPAPARARRAESRVVRREPPDIEPVLERGSISFPSSISSTRIQRKIGPGAAVNTEVRDRNGLYVIISAAAPRKKSGKWHYRLNADDGRKRIFASESHSYDVVRNPDGSPRMRTQAAGPSPATTAVAVPRSTGTAPPPVPSTGPPPVPASHPPMLSTTGSIPTAGPPPVPGPLIAPMTGPPAVPGPLVGPPVVAGPRATPTARPTATVSPVAALYSSLTPTDIDAGKHFLKQLRDTRPQGVNDATVVGSNSNLSNCALTTIGALVGKTASEASMDVQERLGGRAPAGSTSPTPSQPEPKLQKETMWATQLLPASVAPLVNAKVIEAIDVAQFSEGKAEIIGPAQFYGMIRYLQHVFQPSTTPPPGTSATAMPTFTIHQHGTPGDNGDPAATLLRAMQAYPSGTRFAAFVYSSDATQHIRAHWVYAEKFGTQVIFGDYQKNERKPAGGRRAPGATAPIRTDPVAEFLDALPISPDQADAGKGFESGSFVAVVPQFGTGPTPTIADPVITADQVDALLADVGLRLETLRRVHGVTGPDTGSVPAGLVPATPFGQIAIPSPALVKTEVEAFIRLVGQTPHGTLGADPAQWVIHILDHPTISFSDDGAQLKMRSVTSAANVVDASGATSTVRPVSTVTPTATPYIEDLKTGLDFVSSTAALAGDRLVYVNPRLFRFPDLIHEVFHTYSTASTADKPFNEGCTEVFASAVSEKIASTSSNTAYVYAYNADYTPFVARIHELIDLIGLDGVAAAYFDTRGPKEPIAAALVAGWGAGLSTAEADTLALQLTSAKEFPAGFDRAVMHLRGTTRQGTPPSATNAWDADLTRERTAFDARLRTEGARLQSAGTLASTVTTTGTLSDADRTKIADATSRDAQLTVTRQQLDTLYPLLKSATGAGYVVLARQVEGLERSLAVLRATTYEAIHEEFARPVVATITLDAGIVAPSETIEVRGNVPELGADRADRAVPTRRSGATFTTMPIELVRRRGTDVRLTFVARGGTTSPRDVVVHTVTLPSTPTATIRCSATTVVVA